MKKIQRILFLSTIFIFLFPETVAAEGIPFGIKPEKPGVAYFEYTLEPGESVEDTLIASNSSSETIQMIVEAVDGSTAQGGGISYDFSQDSKAKQWIRLENNDNLKIYANHIKRLPFTVTVPLGTPPGEYVFGFLSQLDQSQATPEIQATNASGGQFLVNVISQVAIAVIIHVPGEERCIMEVKDLESSVESGKWKLTLILENSGNVHFSSTGVLEIRNSSTGEKLLEKPLELGYTVPGTTLNAPYYLDLPPTGSYTASLSLQDKNRADCTARYTKEIEYGEKEKEAGSLQLTRIAASLPTAEPTSAPPDSSFNEQIHRVGSPTWILWVSVLVLCIGLGLTFYALSILKRRK